ncbi:ABC transporter substrate-binding protein [Roseomonas sp. OT10]|uniref:ABC transporter substrate-binding protein n=1 Tax=Roseomonas cutis TaxID=2897332 RepID=UPI001E3CC825|nr:ABC transporter substrate-binding protein [Roseomonas sp. OT10]UFN49294.1 ABC transporter substrate-binding protein [Roseomonas sp. OT10]
MLSIPLGLSPTGGRAQPADLAASGLVSELEGAEVVLDPARRPQRFQEAPQLAAEVAAGRLPPVEQRLPAEPLVLQPLQEVGRYGGIWRRGFTGPGDSENGNRINASDRILSWDRSGTRLMPSVARAWEVSPDGRRTTLTLRRGMRWSDGAPFTADDFVFWFEDVYGNRELGGGVMQEMQSQGRPGRVVKIDEVTVAFEFEHPNFLLVEQIAAQTNLGGQSYRQSDGGTFGGYAPAHYLRAFLPRYSSEQEVARKAREAGFETWVQYFHFLKDWRLNPALPTLGPWRTVQPINTPNWVLERNPYYWMVDTAGNQLPYIDRISMMLAENLEVVNLRAAAGSYDHQARHLQLAKLPVFIENQDRAGYAVHIDLATYGSDLALHMNMSYTADPEIGRWLRNADFRRALSLGIDREQLNETFWLGLGTPGSPVVSEDSPENPGPEWRRRWSTHDPAQANRMLDALGLTRRDSQGFRLRTDNGERLVLQAAATQALQPYPQQLEMIAQQWRRIGIFLDVREMERSLAYSRLRTNQVQIFPWSNSGSEKLFLVPQYVLPVDAANSAMGPAYAAWYASGGAAGEQPTDPEILRVMELFRSASAKPEEERNRIAQEIWRVAVDQQWSIGVVGVSPGSFGLRLVSNRLGNVPRRTCIANHCRTPAAAYPQQYFFR